MSKKQDVGPDPGGLWTGTSDRAMSGTGILVFRRIDHDSGGGNFCDATKIVGISLRSLSYSLVIKHERRDAMELQFEKQEIACLVQATRAVKEQEVTQEIRLTQSMPDVGRVLFIFYQQSDHLHAVFKWRPAAVEFVRRRKSRGPDDVTAQPGVQCTPGDRQMSCMRRVKTSAEKCC